MTERAATVATTVVAAMGSVLLVVVLHSVVAVAGQSSWLMKLILTIPASPLLDEFVYRAVELLGVDEIFCCCVKGGLGSKIGELCKFGFDISVSESGVGSDFYFSLVHVCVTNLETDKRRGMMCNDYLLSLAFQSR